MIQDDQTWAAQAACATVEPDQLFGKGAEQRDARSRCFACPVRMECLAEALNSESSFGVWGGLTERERRALLRRFPEVDDWGLWLEREDDELVAEIHARRAPRILARVRCAQGGVAGWQGGARNGGRFRCPLGEGRTGRPQALPRNGSGNGRRAIGHRHDAGKGLGRHARDGRRRGLAHRLGPILGVLCLCLCL